MYRRKSDVLRVWDISYIFVTAFFQVGNRSSNDRANTKSCCAGCCRTGFRTPFNRFSEFGVDNGWAFTAVDDVVGEVVRDFCVKL